MKELCKGVFRVADHELAIKFWKFQKFKMADPIWQLKYILFYIPKKNWVRGFLGLLITNLLSDFEIFKKIKCRIQHGGWKMNILFYILMKELRKGFLRLADHELAIRFWKLWKLKIADPIWWLINIIFYFPMKNMLSGFFGLLITN